MVFIALAAWSYDISRSGRPWTQRLGAAVATAAVAIAVGGGYFGISPQTAALARTAGAVASHSNWELYSPERLQTLRAAGQPVFLNFTAAWCISCLVNERVALRQNSVTEAFKKSGITYLKGDWTHQDPRITEKLAEFARSGVPLYVFYPAGIEAKPVVLPQILTPDIVCNPFIVIVSPHHALLQGVNHAVSSFENQSRLCLPGRCNGLRHAAGAGGACGRSARADLYRQDG